jgi:hypothetical protein
MRLSLKESRRALLNATAVDRKFGIRGPKTMGEALRKPLVLFLLAVPGDWLKEGPVFKEINQTGSHMFNMIAHRTLGAFTVVRLKGLQDRHVRI